MWIFTRYGFYSVVCARQGGGSKPDPDLLMVRARVLAHIENLQGRFPALAGYAVRSDLGTDYRYRIIVPKTVWKEAAAAMAEELSYSNFKNEAARFLGDNGRDYVHALHEIWGVMYGIQSREKG
jgi:hypothetical protein